jgi:hypothetical protein
MMKTLWALALLFLATACASSTKQTDALLRERPAIPASSEIANVPFVQQKSGYCGPATLTMALQAVGKPVTVDQVAPQVYTPQAKGSLQMDMISAGRRQGMMAIPIHGLSPLLREVAAGHPVIVFENLALSWLPQWHYALVYGYDLNAPSVTMHSGPEKQKRWDMRKFERSWKLADYWGLLILPPGELSATATELEHVTAAAALEQMGKEEEARMAYLGILRRWPKSLGPLIGLGNIYFRRHDYAEALKYLRQATATHPESSAAWHNQAVVERYFIER